MKMRVVYFYYFSLLDVQSGRKTGNSGRAQFNYIFIAPSQIIHHLKAEEEVETLQYYREKHNSPPPQRAST